jgi:hypothetical protein
MMMLPLYFSGNERGNKSWKQTMKSNKRSKNGFYSELSNPLHPLSLSLSLAGIIIIIII